MTLEERCAIKVGAWQEGQRCEQDSDMPISYPCHRHDPKGLRHWQRARGHDIPCPDMHSAEIVVRMIEWLAESLWPEPLLIWRDGPRFVVGIYYAETRAAALLHAIDALGE